MLKNDQKCYSWKGNPDEWVRKISSTNPDESCLFFSTFKEWSPDAPSHTNAELSRWVEEGKHSEVPDPSLKKESPDV